MADISSATSIEQRNTNIAQTLERNLKRFETNREGAPVSPNEYYYNLNSNDQKAVIDQFAKALQLPNGQVKMMRFEQADVIDGSVQSLSMVFYGENSKKIGSIYYHIPEKKLERVDIIHYATPSKAVEGRYEDVFKFIKDNSSKFALIAQKSDDIVLIPHLKEQSYRRTNFVSADNDELAKKLITEMAAAYQLKIDPREVQLQVTNSSYTENDGSRRGKLSVFLNKIDGINLASFDMERRGNDWFVSFVSY